MLSNEQSRTMCRNNLVEYLSAPDVQFTGPVWDAVHRDVLEIYAHGTPFLRCIELLVDITERLVAANLNGVISNGLDYPETVFDNLFFIFGLEFVSDFADGALHGLVSLLELADKKSLESQTSEFAQRVRDAIAEMRV